MQRFPPSNKVYVAQSQISNSGRGVFAKCDIQKDELIERCPVIEVSATDTANLNESALVTYFFYWGKDKNQTLIALGFGSLYNHSYQPNAIYKVNHQEKIMDFIALKDIKKDEEITINYKQGNQKNKNPLWFE